MKDSLSKSPAQEKNLLILNFLHSSNNLLTLGRVCTNKMGDLGKYLGNIENFQVVPFLENFNLGNLESCLCPQKALVPTRPKTLQAVRQRVPPLS